MKISFSDLVFQLFFRGILLATAIHEYGHLLGLRAIGVAGIIQSTALNAVYPARPLMGSQAYVFYGSGGLIQAVAFGLMAVRNKDPENRLINIWIAVEGLVYGAFEAFMPRVFWQFGAMVGMMVALLVLVGIIIWRKPEIIP